MTQPPIPAKWLQLAGELLSGCQGLDHEFTWYPPEDWTLAEYDDFRHEVIGELNDGFDHESDGGDSEYSFDTPLSHWMVADFLGALLQSAADPIHDDAFATSTILVTP